MTQYNRIELGKQAKELGFIRDTYEKVCRLSEILSFIENDSLEWKFSNLVYNSV